MGAEPKRSVEEIADEGFRGLTEIFSDPKLRGRAHFRCSLEGPSEIDLALHRAIDEVFGCEEHEYERWVERLYRLGLIKSLGPPYGGTLVVMSR